MSTTKGAIDYHVQINVKSARESDSQRTPLAPIAYRKYGHSEVLQRLRSFANHNMETHRNIQELDVVSEIPNQVPEVDLFRRVRKRSKPTKSRTEPKLRLFHRLGRRYELKTASASTQNIII